MRLSVASSALAAAFVLTPVAAGQAPALCQDFSITNQETGNAARRDLMRQLQAWWDAHAYYPRHASNNDEGGTVKVDLLILPNGRIWTVNMVESSGSPSLDVAGDSVFRGGTVRPFPEGEPKAEIDLSLHYVLAHRHDQPVAAGYMQVASKRPFTIMNDPVKSPVLETMLQKNCTGTQVLGGVPNHPVYGMPSWAQAIFFRKPDGTPWVKFYERGYPVLSPVTQVGKMVTWTGPQEVFGATSNAAYWLQYTVWADGDNHLSGAIGTRMINANGVVFNRNLAGNYIDLSCETEALPTVAWSDWLAQSIVTSPVEHLISYIRVMCDCAGYGYVPVTTEVNLENLRYGRLREFSIRLATPKNLETSNQQQVAIRGGMTDLMGSNLATLVEVTYTSRTHAPDLRPGGFERMARWLRREKQEDRGGIDMIRARIIDADGDSVPLDLLDDVHLGDRSDLTLPDDDPDGSYAIRAAHLGHVFEKNRNTIHNQFG